MKWRLNIIQSYLTWVNLFVGCKASKETKRRNAVKNWGQKTGRELSTNEVGGTYLEEATQLGLLQLMGEDFLILEG